MKIVSFRRTGTNLLAALLFRNFDLPGASCYDDLCFSHSKVPESEPYIATYRPVLPTMLSLWRMRTRVGIAACVPFADFIRMPFDELPAHEGPVQILVDGQLREMANHRPQSSLPAPEWWLSDTVRFGRKAKVVVSYSALVENPMRVLDAVQKAFLLNRRMPLDLCLKRVGWWPVKEEDPQVSWEDARLLQLTQSRLTGSEFKVPVYG